MSLTKRMLEEQGYFDEPVETRKCPKCGGQMQEQPQDYSDMTEGQQADYDAGFNRPFECSKCGEYGLFDVESVYEREEKLIGWEDPTADELIKMYGINPYSFEDVIENALKSKCFVEATSLIHNVIESYLRKRIEDFIAGDATRLQLLKEKFKPQYLKDYNTLCYILGLIPSDKYKLLIDFNKKRNRLIHELLTKSISYKELKEIARVGRQLQIELSPLNHSKEDVKRIMKKFDELTK